MSKLILIYQGNKMNNVGVRMALYEQQQSQGQWQDRLKQERRNISVSVVETLAVGPDEQWSEYVEGNEDSEAYNTPLAGEKNIALIPPRLSLQSKMLPALRSGSFVQSATAAHAAFQQAELQEKQTEQRQVGQVGQVTSQTNIFARIAQRLTSSFAALTFPRVEQTLPVSSVHALTPAPQLRQEQSLSVRENHDASVLPSLVHTIEEPMLPPVKVIDAIPATPSTRPLVAHQQTEPHRLAGHTAKIRLQTAPHPQITALHTAQQVPLSHEEWERNIQESFSFEAPDELREPLVINLNVPDVSLVSTRPDLVAVSPPKKDEHEEPLQEKHAYKTLFGSHAFEIGQAEAMVTQEQVQLSSVIHITLTSNPGQTLVQYVSLHPQAGFTVHLTAPASSRTTFNYALLIPSLEA